MDSLFGKDNSKFTQTMSITLHISKAGCYCSGDSEHIKIISDKLVLRHFDSFMEIEHELNLFRNTRDPNKIQIPFGFAIHLSKMKSTQLISELRGTLREQQSEALRSSLREHQQIAFDEFMELVDNRNEKFPTGALIVAPTGSGKTVLAIAIASALGLRTLIVVPKQQLLTQWEQEIRKFAPNLSIGLIQGAQKYKSGQVILSILRTMGMSKLPESHFDGIDLLIIDEVHNVAASKMSNTFFRFQPSFVIGLSATPERRDNMHEMFKYFLGPKVIQVGQKLEKQSTSIVIHNYTTKHKNIHMRNEKLNLSKMMNNLANELERIDLLAKILQESLDLRRKQKCSSPHTLVVSDRRELLNVLYKRFPNESGLVVGGLSDEKRELACTFPIILGTYAIVSEGFSIKTLNTIVLATPRSNVRQTIGRIFRQTHSVTPIIHDIVDSLQVYKSMGYKRRKDYKTEIAHTQFTIL